MDFEKLKKNLLFSLVIGIVAFAGLSIYSDVDALTHVFVDFNYTYIPIILMLAPLNYLFRYIKWAYYLDLIDIKINHIDSFLIFLSGICMTVTPGKIGELLKSYLLKERVDVPISSTAPLILVERLTDGISMMILASMGVLSYNYGKEALVFIFFCVALFILVVQSPKLVYKMMDLLSKIPLFKKFRSSIENFYNKAYITLKLKPLLFAISLGMISWFFEGLVIYFTVKAIGLHIPVLASVFISCFTTIVGALSMMPGGLFATEGSMVGLLILVGLGKNVAAATTIITRLSTLWLGVMIGLFGFMMLQRKYLKRN